MQLNRRSIGDGESAELAIFRTNARQSDVIIIVYVGFHTVILLIDKL
jgi:hypothetical protein